MQIIDLLAAKTLLDNEAQLMLIQHMLQTNNTGSAVVR